MGFFSLQTNVGKVLTPIIALNTYCADKKKHTNGVIKSSAVVARNWTQEHTDLPHSNEMLREAKKNPRMTVSELHRLLHSWSCQVSKVSVDVTSIITSCLHALPVRYLSTNDSITVVCFGQVFQQNAENIQCKIRRRIINGLRLF